LLNLADKQGYQFVRPLILAIRANRLEIVSYLLQGGANIQILTQPLYVLSLPGLAENGSTEIMALLVEKGLDVNAVVMNGESLLDLACSNENIDMVRWLLEHGAKMHTIMPENGQEFEKNVPAFLLNNGTSEIYSLVEQQGATTLEIALATGNAALVRLLLEKGADEYVTFTTEKFTPLHLSALAQQTDLLALCVAHGADINIKSATGLTPLHLACLARNAPAVAWLLAHGAKADMIMSIPTEGIDLKQGDIQQYPGFGTPMMLAVGIGDPAIEQLFLQHGVKPFSPEARQAFVSAFAGFRAKYTQARCMSNLKQLDLCALMYAQDHQETLPKAETVWKDLLDAGAAKELLRCPAKPDAANGYGYNVALSGKGLGNIQDPSNTIIFADSNSADNLIHSLNDIDLACHGDGILAAFVDGHVAFITLPAKLK
jgi:ankyrin repeat protein